MNPLLHLHEQAEAETQAYGDIPIVSTFGQPQAEYAALHTACGLMDVPQLAIVEIAGPDRFAFLDNLITQQVYDRSAKKGVEPGTVRHGFMLNTKGRIEAELTVVETGTALWLVVDRRLAGDVVARLGKYHFTEKISIRARSDDLHVLALHGPRSSEALRVDSGAGEQVADLAQMRSGVMPLGGAEVRVWRDDVTIWPGLFLAVPTARVVEVWTRLRDLHASAAPGKRALRPIGWAAFNAVRVESGRPMFGIDFDDTTLPAETGLFGRAVSTTKGCYLGQEVVARMFARQQVARCVAGLRMQGDAPGIESDALPVAGAPVFDHEDNQVGVVTSSTVSPVLSNACLALALLKRPYFQVGSVVRVAAEGKLARAVVSATPFVRQGDPHADRP